MVRQGMLGYTDRKDREMGNNVTLTPLENIVLSKTNPRKHFDQDELDQLADSIKTHGVLQPVLVRPTPGPNKKVELVVGERRFRASKQANVKTIPTITKSLNAEEVIELQLIENLQRSDLSEIEEARGYRYMMDQFDYKADDLAEKINKSRAYIYGRLKLTNLFKKGQKSLEKGEISASTALLIARIPGNKQQEAALKRIVQKDWRGHPMTYRQAKEYIEENFMIRLKGSGFDRKDPKLVAKAGPCTTCPKRTGNQTELYPDISTDVCTDPECFRTKVQAAQLIQIEKAKAKGQAVLTGKEAKKHIEYGQLKHSSPLIKLDSRNYDGPYKDGKYSTYGKLLGKDTPPITLIKTDKGLLPTINQKEADAILAKKFKWAKQSLNSDQKWKDEQKRDAKKRRIQTLVFKESLAQIATQATNKMVLTDEFWRFLARALVHSYHNSDSVQSLIKRRDIPYKKAKNAWEMKWGEQLLKYLDTVNGSILRSIIVELVVHRGGHRDWEGKLHGSFKEACTMYDVDHVQIEKDIKATARAKAKKKKKKATKKKAKKTTKQKSLVN